MERVQLLHTRKSSRNKKNSDDEFDAKVCNEEDKIYDIHLDLNHPRKSTCNCPHADGRRIICKHMIASFFTIFPDQAKEYIKEIERYEKEQEEQYQQSLEMQEQRKKDIKKYVNKLTKSELKEKRIEYMIHSELYDDDLY